MGMGRELNRTGSGFQIPFSVKREVSLVLKFGGTFKDTVAIKSM